MRRGGYPARMYIYVLPPPSDDDDDVEGSPGERRTTRRVEVVEVGSDGVVTTREGCCVEINAAPAAAGCTTAAITENARAAERNLMSKMRELQRRILTRKPTAAQPRTAEGLPELRESAREEPVIKGDIELNDDCITMEQSSEDGEKSGYDGEEEEDGYILCLPARSKMSSRE
ncbi:hypothetical protein ACP70R_007405 [Stipagrostis hirtigluma subsp. patula]